MVSIIVGLGVQFPLPLLTISPEWWWDRFLRFPDPFRVCEAEPRQHTHTNNFYSNYNIMSKGSKPRTTNKRAYDRGYDRIFGSQPRMRDFMVVKNPDRNGRSSAYTTKWENSTLVEDEALALSPGYAKRGFTIYELKHNGDYKFIRKVKPLK